MKIIFLDFDGVITIPPKWNLAPDKIKSVKKIVDETGAKIVVSSSWRHGLERHFAHVLENDTNNEMIIWLRDNILDITPNVGLGNGRGGEIQQWLNDHREVTNYVILDDMDCRQFRKEHHSHLVTTNHFSGLDSSSAQEAIRLLI